MEEERKLRHRIALLLSTKSSYICIEKTEPQTDNKRRIYANVKGINTAYLWTETI